ncbi:hypothetical protein F511_04524 [Dorcoceras hygrometricum]|uniref:Uncharacterized protein n=1 Tax=Dorcoceras hygrometricum TaxID=472368 RepID=A0A2Z7D306_9LAMI|nr:hypothetical protein F511_04524 [Dorcoceras hygrometricum]
MGIDQLEFQSVQLGYLKILQIGNADPNNTKEGKEYEIIGHNGLLISWQQSQSSLYTRTVYQPRKSSGSSAITARWFSDTTNQSVTTPMIVLYLSGTTHLSAGHNVALSKLELSLKQPKSLTQKLKRAEELSGLASRKRSINTATSRSSPTSTQAT